MLKEYYKEVKKVLQETTAISQTEQEEFVAGAEQYIADLENNRYTILVAGKTYNCYSCLKPERPYATYRNNIKFVTSTDQYFHSNRRDRRRKEQSY